MHDNGMLVKTRHLSSWVVNPDKLPIIDLVQKMNKKKKRRLNVIHYNANPEYRCTDIRFNIFLVG